MVLVPTTYHEDYKTLELEYPWLTLDAITWLDRYIKPTMSALDIGTGGSTIFFARRCHEVIAVNNNPEWNRMTRTALAEKKITNAVVYDVTCLDEIKSLINRRFDIVLVDCCDISRHECAKWSRNFADVVVIDNFSAPYVGDIDPLFNPGWNAYRHCDLHWVGSGTVIYERINKC